MKKLFVLLMALVMCLSCFASCSTLGGDTDTTEGGNGSSEPTLADAVEYLNSVYKDSAKETPADYDLVNLICGTLSPSAA